jgi:hypothetical protein
MKKNEKVHAKEKEFNDCVEFQEPVRKFTIRWVKNYYATGTVEIEAPTEEEAMQIAEDNIGCYEGHMEMDFDKNEIESWGEVKE